MSPSVSPKGCSNGPAGSQGWAGRGCQLDFLYKKGVLSEQLILFSNAGFTEKGLKTVNTRFLHKMDTFEQKL